MFQKAFFVLICCAASLGLTSLPLQAQNPKSLELNEQGVSALQKSDYEKAESLLRQALILDEGNLSAAYNLAGLYLGTKREQQAIALLRDYQEKGVDDLPMLARLGDAYFGSKQLDLAAKSYEKVLSKEPKYPGVAARLGTVYSLQDRLQEAEKALLQAVEMEPKNGEIVSNLSAIYLANGKAEKAISAAKRALAIEAKKETYITLGMAYENLKDYDNSLIAFQRAADLGDDNEALEEKIEEIEEKLDF